jgi:CheY-like chemotaxis protein
LPAAELRTQFPGGIPEGLIGAARPRPSSTPDPTMSAHILVVDDEPDISALVAYHLAREAYRVRTAASGPEALRAAALERPDLIVLDLMLPGMPGLAVLEELRRRPETQDVPVILLTARREEQDRIAGLKLGASAWCLMSSPRPGRRRPRRCWWRGRRSRSRLRLTRKSDMAGADPPRVLHHVGEEDAEHGVVQRVHPVVAARRPRGRPGVAADEGVERVGEHLARLARHLLDLGLRVMAGSARCCGLGDVDRVVADALQVVGDLHRHRDQPEVARHRLLQREQVDALSSISTSSASRRGRRR